MHFFCFNPFTTLELLIQPHTNNLFSWKAPISVGYEYLCGICVHRCTVLRILKNRLPNSYRHSHFINCNNLCSCMMNLRSFETELHLHPWKNLVIRNMCDGGDTPGFRPHSGRGTPWAFPGADKFQTELESIPRPAGISNILMNASAALRPTYYWGVLVLTNQPTEK
jgi:hypothetical protein